MFLLVLAYLGSPGQSPESCKTVVVVVVLSFILLQPNMTSPRDRLRKMMADMRSSHERPMCRPSLLMYCVTFAESGPYCHSILFVCLSVWMSVSHSATYSLPRLIDHNQICLAGIYLSSDPCKPFWIPYLPYFWCQMEKYAKFRLFPTAAFYAYSCHCERDALCHMTCFAFSLALFSRDNC